MTSHTLNEILQCFSKTMHESICLLFSYILPSVMMFEKCIRWAIWCSLISKKKLSENIMSSLPMDSIFHHLIRLNFFPHSIKSPEFTITIVSHTRPKYPLLATVDQVRIVYSDVSNKNLGCYGAHQNLNSLWNTDNIWSVFSL